MTESSEASAGSGAAGPAPALDERVFALLERAWDCGVLLFAAWTVVVHVLVFVVPGSFAVLRWLGLALLALTPLLVRFTRSSPAPYAPAPSAAPEIVRVDRMLHFLIACLLTLAFALNLNYLIFWGGSLLFLAVVYLRSSPPAGALYARAVGSRAGLIWFGALIALSMVLTAIAHRPDTDDGFLINLSVWVLDNPGKLLYAEDGVHNLPGLPIAFPTYRSHTIEILYGWLAWVLQLEPIQVAHLLLPPLSSAAALVSSALLLRVLLPRGWLLGVTTLVAFWITMGDTHDGFANHAYVRIFQGKAILVTALLPYLAFAVIRFMESGRRLHWLLVLAALVGACGLSATGLFAAPLALGAAAAASWRPTRESTTRLFATLAAAGYPFAIALAMRSQVVDKLDILNGDALYGFVKTFPASFIQILGLGPYLFVQLVGLLGACALAPDRLRRRWLAGLSLVYFALVMNPFLFDLWVKYVTSAPVAWRLWWMVPVPILLACAFGAAFAGGADSRRVPRLLAFALALAAIFGLAPRVWSLSPRNGVTFASPGIKAPARMYALSETVQRLTPKGYSVLAPREIAMWITTRRGHPRMVAHKENMLKVMAPYMGQEQFGLRMHLFAYVSAAGRSERSPQLLAYAIDRLRIGLVATAVSTPWLREIEDVMRTAGFTRKQERGYVLFYRPPNHAAQARARL